MRVALLVAMYIPIDPDAQQLVRTLYRADNLSSSSSQLTEDFRDGVLMRETGFVIDTIASMDGFMALEHEWRELESRMQPLPFASFDWVAAWWMHLRSTRPIIKDELCLITFRSDEGRLVGVAPMMMTSRPGSGVLSIRQLQFIGADTNVTELRCVAAAATDMHAIYRSLVLYLQKNAINYDWMKLTGIPQDSSLLDHVTTVSGKADWSREVINFYLELKPTWAEFKSGLSRNMKESLRKSYNAPKRDGVEFEFVVVSDGPELDAGIAEFFRLHSARATLSDTVAHPDIFRGASSQRFLQDVCRRFARRDKVRIFQLRHRGAVIATRIGFAMNDSLYLYYSGYEPAFAKYSAMTRTVAEAIQYAIESGYRTVNLSTGRDISKERWGPSEAVYYELEVASNTALSRLKYRIFKAAGNGLKIGALANWIGRVMARNAAVVIAVLCPLCNVLCDAS
jgi:CelD/BcsL family acetyltransferase involved in cellulose biosynthesis